MTERLSPFAWRPLLLTPVVMACYPKTRSRISSSVSIDSLNEGLYLLFDAHPRRSDAHIAR